MELRWIPPLLALLGVASLGVWLATDTTDRLQARIPGMDNRPVVEAGPYVPPPVTRTLGSGTPSAIVASWSQFRGDQRDAIVHDSVRLARSWSADGPPVLWSLQVGPGYAGAAVYGGCVYIIDYDVDNQADALRCLSLDDGREIWRHSYPAVIKQNHGMSRTVPAVTEEHCVAIGPLCHVSCVDRRTGDCRWMIDMAHEYGAEWPEWYTGQCPLVEDDRVILAPASPDVMMVAVHLETGEEIWRTPNVTPWRMSHASVMPMELDGRKTYVYVANGGVVGVDAATGELLWRTDAWKVSIATCPSPVVLPEQRLFFCGGYNSGAMLLRVEGRGNGSFEAVVETPLSFRVFGSTQQTPILYNNHLFGIRQTDKQFVCLDLQGREVWASGREVRFGDGPYLIADGLILIVHDDGTLTLAEASTVAYRPLAQANPLRGHDAWAPLALVEGRLLLRDMDRMICLDLADPTAR